MLRKPRVSSARFRRFAAVNSLGLAICLGFSARGTLREEGAGSELEIHFRPAGPLDRHVRVVQDVMAFNLDREVGAGVAVDVALDDGEIAVGA